MSRGWHTGRASHIVTSRSEAGCPDVSAGVIAKMLPPTGDLLWEALANDHASDGEVGWIIWMRRARSRP
jgi:hypothetical protein